MENSYILLAYLEDNLLKNTCKSYLKEGYSELLAHKNVIILKKTDGNVNEDSELKMCSVFISMMNRMRFDRPVVMDISSLINRNIERLESNEFKSLKFNDRFIWEIRQLLAAEKVKREL